MSYENNQNESCIPLKPFFSLNEFSKLLGRHRDTVKRYIDYGYIKANKVMGRWVISRAELIKCMTS
jgi:hypothetical protein